MGEMAINCAGPSKTEAKRSASMFDRTAARAGAQSSPPCSFNLLTNPMDFREKHRCSMACKPIGLILLSRRLQDWPIEKPQEIPEEAFSIFYSRCPYCGELDQGTEAGLINLFRWV